MITNNWIANRRNLLQSIVLHYNGQNPISTILPTFVYYSSPYLSSLLSSNNFWYLLLSSDLPSVIYYSIPFDSVLFHSILFQSVLICVIPFYSALFHFILIYSVLFYPCNNLNWVEFNLIELNCIVFYCTELDASYWTLRWWL